MNFESLQLKYRKSEFFAELSQKIGGNLPIGTATRVDDKQGAQYTLAIYPVSRGQGYVVAAVSWNQLLGGLKFR